LLIRSQSIARYQRAEDQKFVTARSISVSAAAGSDLGCRWRYQGSDCSRYERADLLTIPEVSRLRRSLLVARRWHRRHRIPSHRQYCPLDRAAPYDLTFSTVKFRLSSGRNTRGSVPHDGGGRPRTTGTGGGAHRPRAVPCFS
jgi:hypothetical protein